MPRKRTILPHPHNFHSYTQFPKQPHRGRWCVHTLWMGCHPTGSPKAGVSLPTHWPGRPGPAGRQSEKGVCVHGKLERSADRQGREPSGGEEWLGPRTWRHPPTDKNLGRGAPPGEEPLGVSASYRFPWLNLLFFPFPPPPSVPSSLSAYSPRLLP